MRCAEYLYCTFPKDYLLKQQLLVFATNKHNIGCHDEALILSYIGGNAISHNRSKKLQWYCAQKGHDILSGHYIILLHLRLSFYPRVF